MPFALHEQFLFYLIAAGVATLVDMLVYAVCFQTLRPYRHKWNVRLAALTVSFTCGMVTNFLLSKYLVFQGSNLGTERQFVAFFLIALVVFAANYYFMKWLEHVWARRLAAHPVAVKLTRFEPLLVRGVSAGTLSIVSFIGHKLVSFSV